MLSEASRTLSIKIEHQKKNNNNNIADNITNKTPVCQYLKISVYDMLLVTVLNS